MADKVHRLNDNLDSWRTKEKAERTGFFTGTCLHTGKNLPAVKGATFEPCTNKHLTDYIMECILTTAI